MQKIFNAKTAKAQSFWVLPYLRRSPFGERSSESLIELVNDMRLASWRLRGFALLLNCIATVLRELFNLAKNVTA